jgi:hypothetical protein
VNEAAQQTPEFRVQEIKLRRAEIKVDLTAMKHAYVSGGTERPHAERTGLEAEDAALALELLRIGSDAIKAKAQRRQTLNDGLLGRLLRLLHARGDWDIAVEAAGADIDLSEITPWRTASTNLEEETRV